MFSAHTQPLYDLGLSEEDMRVFNKTIPDLQLDLQGAGGAFEDVKQMGLSGERPLGEVKTKAPDSYYHQIMPPVAARQAEVARDYLKRAARIDDSTATHRAPTGLWSPRSKGTTGVRCWSS